MIVRNSIRRTHETMGFKINLLFILVVSNMFSMGYLCNSNSYEPPKYCFITYDSGPCLTTEMITNGTFLWRYYYSKLLETCFPFKYGGCGGNGNRFSTYEVCMNICHI